MANACADTVAAIFLVVGVWAILLVVVVNVEPETCWVNALVAVQKERTENWLGKHIQDTVERSWSSNQHCDNDDQRFSNVAYLHCLER